MNAVPIWARWVWVAVLAAIILLHYLTPSHAAGDCEVVLGHCVISRAELQARFDKAFPPAQSSPYGDLGGATRAITLDLWSCVLEQTCRGA